MSESIPPEGEARGGDQPTDEGHCFNEGWWFWIALAIVLLVIAGIVFLRCRLF